MGYDITGSEEQRDRVGERAGFSSSFTSLKDALVRRVGGAFPTREWQVTGRRSSWLSFPTEQYHMD